MAITSTVTSYSDQLNLLLDNTVVAHNHELAVADTGMGTLGTCPPSEALVAIVSIATFEFSNTSFCTSHELSDTLEAGYLLKRTHDFDYS